MTKHPMGRHGAGWRMAVLMLAVPALVMAAAAQGHVPMPDVIALAVGAPALAIAVVVLHGAVPLALVHAWLRRRHNSSSR